MRLRRRLSRVPLTSSSATASDLLLAFHSADEESISEPQEMIWVFQLSAREFLEPAAAQSIHTHRLVHISQCDMATSVSLLSHVAENHVYSSVTWMRWTCAMRASLSTSTSTRSSSKYVEFARPMRTRESLSAQLISAEWAESLIGLQLQPVRLAPLAAAASQCHQPAVVSAQCHSHTRRVSESFMWHTLFGTTLVMCICVCSVHVAQVAGVVAHAHWAHHFVVEIRKEQLVARRVVAHSPDAGILLFAGTDEGPLRDAPHELQTRPTWGSWWMAHWKDRCSCERSSTDILGWWLSSIGEQLTKNLTNCLLQFQGRSKYGARVNWPSRFRFCPHPFWGGRRFT